MESAIASPLHLTVQALYLLNLPRFSTGVDGFGLLGLPLLAGGVTLSFHTLRCFMGQAPLLLCNHSTT